MKKETGKLPRQVFVTLDETRQDPSKAPHDPQFHHMQMSLSESMVGNKGTIIDVGCGNQALFFFLAECVDEFKKRKGWRYLGVDDTGLHSKVARLLKKSPDLQPRFAAMDLNSFYLRWPDSNAWPKPHVVIVRNVLHHLNIKETAGLLRHIGAHLDPSDVLFLQEV